MRRPSLPPIDAGRPQDTLRFLEYVTRRDTYHRIDRMSMWEKVRNYVLHNQQWLRPDYSWGDTTRTPFWTTIEAPGDRFFPMPVHNALIEPCENEWARLLGSGFESEVIPTDADSRRQRAADLANDVLRSTLRRLGWPITEAEGVMQSILFGTWIAKTGWETDFRVTLRMPKTTAVQCTAGGCSFKLAHPGVPKSRVQDMMADRNSSRIRWEPDGPKSTNPFDEVPMKGTVDSCLTCPTPQPLRTYMPSPEEAKSAKDFFKRDLGMNIPQSDVFVGNVSVYDWFPENDGIVSRNQMRECGEERIVPVEWARDRFANGYLVEPEDIKAELKWHPIVSSVHGWDEANAWDHHCVARFYSSEPTTVWNDDTRERFLDTGEVTLDLGRCVVACGRHIMIDDDLMVERAEAPGEYLPRWRYAVMPWAHRENEALGLSAAELGIGIQDTINTRLSQVQYVRHVFGNPKVLAAEGSQINQAGYMDTGYAGDVIYYQDGASGRPPEVVPGHQLDGNWLQEHEADLEGIARAIGTHEVETGQPPGDSSITAASAFIHLSKQAGTRRQPRTVRYAFEKQGMFKHVLEWIQEGYREPRMYQLEGVTKRLSIKSFLGSDIMGQTDVRVTVRPEYDSPDFRRQNILDMLDKGILQPQSAGDRKRIAKEMGAPLDILSADSNRQVDIAEEEYVSFYLDGRAPIVRLRGDDHIIHGQQHLLNWLSPDAERRKEECGWYEAEAALDGWDKQFDGLLSIEQGLEMEPTALGPRTPMADPISGLIGPRAVHSSVQLWLDRMKAESQVQKMPKTLEMKVYAFMRGIVIQRVFPNRVGLPMPLEAPEGDNERYTTVMGLLRFFAHIETHARKAMMDAMKAQAGMMEPAAPEGTQNAQGMVPGSPAEALPGAGAGPGAVTAAPA